MICQGIHKIAWILLGCVTKYWDQLKSFFDTPIKVGCNLIQVLNGLPLCHRGEVVYHVEVLLHGRLLECLQLLQGFLHILVLLLRYVSSPSLLLLLSHLVLEDILNLFVEDLHWVSRMENVIFGFIADLLDKFLAHFARSPLGEIFFQVGGHSVLHEVRDVDLGFDAHDRWS